MPRALSELQTEVLLLPQAELSQLRDWLSQHAPSVDAKSVEVVKAYLDDLKFRHINYWHLVYRLTFAVLFLLSIPFLYPEKLHGIRQYALLFPSTALFISALGGWILYAEAIRIQYISLKYDELKPRGSEYKRITGWRRIFVPSIARVTAAFFWLGSVTLSLFALFAVRNFLRVVDPLYFY